MKTLQDAVVGNGVGETTHAITYKKEVTRARSATHRLIITSWTIVSVLNVPLSTTEEETTRG